jgi:hypothetical protein
MKLQPILQRQAFNPTEFAGIICHQNAPCGQRRACDENVIYAQFPDAVL